MSLQGWLQPLPFPGAQLQQLPGHNLIRLEIYPGSLILHGGMADDNAPYGLLFEPEPNGTDSFYLVNLQLVAPVQVPNTER